MLHTTKLCEHASVRDDHSADVAVFMRYQLIHMEDGTLQWERWSHSLKEHVRIPLRYVTGQIVNYQILVVIFVSCANEHEVDEPVRKDAYAVNSDVPSTWQSSVI